MIVGGRFVVLAAVALAAAAWSGSLGIVFLVVLGLIALAAVDAFLALPTGDLDVQHPEVMTGRRGEPTSVPVVITNAGKRTFRGRVRDAWQPSLGIGRDGSRHALSLAAGTSQRFEQQATPVRQGTLQHHHVAVWSFGPLRLAGRSGAYLGAHGESTVAVYPPFRTRAHVPGLLRHLKWVEGQVATRLRGQGTEFDSLREYVPGDDIRSLDWRATARRQELVVRTWRPEQDRRILVVIDSSRVSGIRVGEEPALDAAVEATLLLSTVAVAAGDRVDVLVMDAQVRKQVPGIGRGLKVNDALVALADVEPTLFETNWIEASAEILRRSRKAAAIVVLTAVDAAMSPDVVQLLITLQGKHSVIVAGPTDGAVYDLAQTDDVPSDGIDTMTRAAAARLLLSADAVKSTLAARGVRPVTDDPYLLGKRVTEAYLDLKLQGKL